MTINEYSLPGTTNLWDVATGLDGNLWVLDGCNDQVLKVAPPNTVLATYALGGRCSDYSESGLFDIAIGADGSTWFTERNRNRVARITPSGQLAEFAVPTPNSAPTGITAGPDCNLWFTENYGSKVGRITPAGAIEEYPITFPSQLSGITSGPDGALWFAEYNPNKIGRLTTAGALTEYQLSVTAGSGGGGVDGITAGSDGNLWFFMDVANTVGRITPAGVITYFPVRAGASSTQHDIITGPDGNLWFNDAQVNSVAQVSTSGSIVENAVPTNGANPSGLVVGPDGNVWLTEASVGKLGQVPIPGPTPPGSPRNVSAIPDSRSGIDVSWTAPWNGGGSTITSYTVTPLLGGVAQPSSTVSGSPAPTSAVVTNLNPQLSYTFSVNASNSVGTGPAAFNCHPVAPGRTMPAPTASAPPRDPANPSSPAPIPPRSASLAGPAAGATSAPARPSVPVSAGVPTAGVSTTPEPHVSPQPTTRLAGSRRPAPPVPERTLVLAASPLLLGAGAAGLARAVGRRRRRRG